jgi:hypothetical protein
MRQKAIDELLANRAEIDLQLALLDFQESENGARRKGSKALHYARWPPFGVAWSRRSS